MDPNKALEEARELARKITLADGNGPGVSPDDAVELANLFDAIDGWLSKGSFLPAAWYQASAARGEQVFPKPVGNV